MAVLRYCLIVIFMRKKTDDLHAQRNAIASQNNTSHPPLNYLSDEVAKHQSFCNIFSLTLK